MGSANQVIPGLQVKIDYILRKKLTLAEAARQGEVSIISFRHRFHSEVKNRNTIMYDALVANKFAFFTREKYDIPTDGIQPDLSDLQSCERFFREC